MPSVATMSRFGTGCAFGLLLRPIEQIPVGFRQDHVRAELVLQVLRAAGVIAVTMADDHVLDLRRIEPELLHAADDLVLDRIVEDRVDDDDAPAT